MWTPKQSLAAAAVAFAIAGLGAGIASAQDKDKIVSDRIELMKQQGREMVVVRNYFQDKGADQQAAAAAIASLTKSVPTVVDKFPAGTAMGQVSVKSRAKPEIWTEHDKFVAADKKVGEQIAQLDAAVKSGDKPKVEAVFNEIKFCAACHDAYRAKEQ